LIAGIAEVSYQAANRSVVVRAIEPGTTSLLVRDLCLSVQKTAAASVVVHGVVRVELEVVDKLELGSSATGHLKLFAANNQVK
jgi:hypothetical protein